MNCELCGFSDGTLYRTEIEGAILTVCGECSKNGKVIGEVKKPESTTKQNHQQQQGSMEIELRLDYSNVISKALKDSNISIDELSNRLKESRLTLKKVAEGKITPTDELAGKLEDVLGISLFEKVYTGYSGNADDGHITFADIVQFKDKTKQG